MHIFDLILYDGLEGKKHKDHVPSIIGRIVISESRDKATPSQKKSMVAPNLPDNGK